MDIKTYDYIFEGLKNYNADKGKPYGNKVMQKPPIPNKDNLVKYPITIISEIRNVANESFDSKFDRVANLGYKISVFAKRKGEVESLQIARELSKLANDYLTNIGLKRVSYNDFDLENDGSIHAIIMTFSGNLHENTRRLI